MSLRLSERSSFEARIKDLDEKGVEMKMQVIELEVEMEKRQQQYEATTSQLKDKLSKQAEEAIVQHSLWMKERSQLKVEIDEASIIILYGIIITERFLFTERKVYD